MQIGWSIRYYLAALVLATAVPLFALLVYSLQDNYWQAVGDAQDEARRLSELVAADGQRFLHDSQAFLAGMAVRPRVRSLDPERCDPIIADSRTFFPYFTNLAIADVNGNVVCSALPMNQSRRPSVKDRQWFIDARMGNKPMVGKAAVGSVSGRWVSVMSHPIRTEDGAFDGLIGFAIDLARYPLVPGNFPLPAGLVAYLVDDAGVILSRSSDAEAWVGKAFPDIEALTLARSSTSGGATVVGRGADERLIAYVPVAGTNWHVISVQPAEYALRHLWLRANQKYAGGLLLVALGALLAWCFSRRILRPMASIMRTANHIADGDFSRRAKSNKGPLEIAALAASFNRMLDTRLRAEEKYRDLLESASDAIIVIDAAGKMILVNAKAEEYFGYSRDEMLRQPVDMLVATKLREKHRSEVEEYVDHGVPRDLPRIVNGLRKDGTEFPCEITLNPFRTGDELVVSAFVRDLTERTKYQEQLEYLSQYDTLTCLPNRHLLRDRLPRALNRATLQEGRIAVMYIDLDGFKAINDFHGHAFADRLLQLAAERMRMLISDVDTLARIGSDEFCAVIEIFGEGDAHILDLAEAIRTCLATPMLLDGKEIHLSASMGIAFFPNDGAHPDALLKNADLALTHAKREGGNTFCFFEEEMDVRAAERQQVLSCLRRAQERQELLLHYQPQVETGTGRLVGVEALLRWQSPELGMVGPDRFIPLAEEAGLIVNIGKWVLETACQQAVAWQKEGMAPIIMAVNLSARQFRQSDLVLMVRQALSESGLQPSLLELEITEGMLMQDPERAVSTLQELHGIGVHVSVDDFGTGYSSLAYLKRFPVTQLKIDRSFVRDIPGDSDDAAIVTAVVSLAHNLRIGVIAEGVESEEQRAFLLGLNCDLCQGYLFSRPVSAERIPLYRPPGADRAAS